jgi:hypothetical protein
MLANLDQVILLAPGYFAARRRGRPRLSLDAIAHGRPFLEHARVSSLPSARCTPSLRPTCLVSTRTNLLEVNLFRLPQRCVCEQPPTRRRLGDFSYFKDMVLISKGSFGRVYRAVRLSDNMESDNMPTELGVLGSTVESASQL